MEKALTATITSKVYAYIIANPGATSREIRKGMNIPGHVDFGSRLAQLIGRGAVMSVPGESPRNTRYYKGAAPVKLNQPRGISQKSIRSELDILKKKQELVRDIQLLLAQVEAMGK
jgi:hypothetical protein